MNEFDDIVQRLRDERPELSSLELDQIKQRARMRARRTRKGSQPMKSRLAILATLVTGVLFSMTGAGLAVGGLTTGNDASVGQYGQATPPPSTTPTPPKSTPKSPPKGDVLGEDDSGTPAPKSESNDTAPAQTAAQPTRQVEAGATGNELPFTGFAAIPVLLIGIALLTTGLVLRRRQANDN